MQKATLRYAIFGIAGLLAFSAPTHAEVVQFKADLRGDSEVPANQTTGSGLVTATFDTASRLFSWRGNFSGLTGDATASHFHGPASPGKNAGFVIWISEKGQALKSPFQGTATLTEDQASDLVHGYWYVNVHTTANPGGELRGQVMQSH
jgi:hypothetical protein